MISNLANGCELPRKSIAHERAAGYAGTVEDGCALGGTGHRVARVGAAFCRAPRSPATSLGPVGVPARLRACSQARPCERRRGRESAGRSGRRRCTPASSPAVEVGAMPTWHRNSLGVGRVARRARPDTKPYSRYLPRLTLKAGHKEGLPTTPIAACGAMSPSVRADFLFMRKHTCNLLCIEIY